MEPLAIEIRVSEELVVRGQEWPVQGPPVVMVHDLNEDLDCWKGADRLLAERGFRVITLDLPNHGLSDDESEDDSLLENLTEVIKSVAEVWGPLGLCSYGSVSSELCEMRGPDAPMTHVMISPRARQGGSGLPPDLEHQMSQLVIAATNDGDRSEEARALFDSLGAKKLWASVAANVHGPDLIKSHTHLVDDMAIFLRRTLVSAHLEWTAATHEKAAADFRTAESEGE
ncbi:MAG: alpha/beta hydrolase [Acidimicrobiales bacterium]|nr:alpha/beta hydrolase [Acidimicrobiales bacterium]